MYILLSPATGADITARTGTANQPVTARIAAGVPVRGRAESPVTSWGAFHYEDPTAEQLAENYGAVYDEILRMKPAAAKGKYVKSITVSSTMSPGVKVDPSVNRNYTEPAAE